MKIVISPSFGAGWSTWASYGDDSLDLAEDRQLVSLVERGERDQAIAYAANKWEGVYTAGLAEACVVEVPQGALYRIREYDGSESVEILDLAQWRVAE